MSYSYIVYFDSTSLDTNYDFGLKAPLIRVGYPKYCFQGHLDMHQLLVFLSRSVSALYVWMKTLFHTFKKPITCKYFISTVWLIHKSLQWNTDKWVTVTIGDKPVHIAEVTKRIEHKNANKEWSDNLISGNEHSSEMLTSQNQKQEWPKTGKAKEQNLTNKTGNKVNLDIRFGISNYFQ